MYPGPHVTRLYPDAPPPAPDGTWNRLAQRAEAEAPASCGTAGHPWDDDGLLELRGLALRSLVWAQVLAPILREPATEERT